MSSTDTETYLGFRDARGGYSPYVPRDRQFEGALSLDFVADSLFGWDAVRGVNDVTYTAPAQITPDGVTPAHTVTRRDEDRITVVRADTGAFLGVFSNGYALHQYREWLVRNMQKIVSDDVLAIAGAGLTHGGARGWLIIEAPESLQGPDGLAYRTNIIAGSSFDGSLSTTYRSGIQLPICGNQINGFLAGKAQRIKIKSTKNSLSRIGDVQEALGIMRSVGDDFAAYAERLMRTPVTARQFRSVLGLAIPVTETPGSGRTQALRKHDEVTELYTRDDRVVPWTGSAFGVLQAMNTWVNHMVRISRDANRLERTMDRTLDGQLEKADNAVIAHLERVLGLELVGA